MNNPNFAIQKYVTGSDIKRVRKTLRLTQKKFAELVGVSKATMERWETKEDKITGPVVLLLKILEDHPEYVTKIQIPDKKYGLRMWYMHEQEICTLIDVDELILKDLDLPFYDPLMIIQKTEGRMAEDHFWIQIER